MSISPKMYVTMDACFYRCAPYESPHYAQVKAPLGLPQVRLNGVSKRRGRARKIYIGSAVAFTRY